MRTFTKDELKYILDNHKKWLNNEDGGERADLRGSDLRGSDLRWSDLRWSDLRGSDLRWSDLSWSDLRWSDLSGSDLSGSKIDDKLLAKFFPIACPESGSFIGWKKAKDKIVKLEICDDAKRSSAFSRKCRCSAAKVLAIENIDGTDSGLNEIASDYNNDFIYRVGESVSVDDFDEDRKKECAPGIHFFITRQEAVDW